ELAYALAGLARVWRAAVAAGQESGAALARIPVTLTADQDQFATIAKFRAARRLIALMAEAAGVTTAPKLHAETAWRMMAGLDVHTNLLRTTIAAFAAGVGGAANIAGVEHCMTRLRLTLNDTSKADTKTIQAIAGVQGTL
ncbi:PTS transporter subunit EIIB, partial [Mycobacterium tuberculosis]|nr:PTS transporter subunit EIIB [Mycobacterium tuberculosis]